MTIDEGKKLIIKAGRKLIKSGLIVRTWGNISCRIDENSFLITPSGRDYTSLTPDEIVAVNICDHSYRGNIKPSSEKRIHAGVYKLFPKINFVIHTHQENASIISATDLDSIKLPQYHPQLGNEIFCASYSLPGTRSLSRKVCDALLKSDSKAVIMKYHGALCIGENCDEAFNVASELERVCHKFILDKQSQLKDTDKLSKQFNNSKFIDLPDSKRKKDGFILHYADDKTSEFQLGQIKSSHPIEAHLYNAIYAKYYNINYILHKSTPEINQISSLGIPLKPLLDDFAQIAGPVAKNVSSNHPTKIVSALKKSSVVFMQDAGALCCGQSRDDAIAIGMITEKNSKAYLTASLLGRIRPINPLEARLMRFVYRKKYSQQMNKKS